jgi:hypothetical protein
MGSRFDAEGAGLGRRDDGWMRVAIVGTPRSGNTWLRGLLAGLYDLRELAVATPGEIDWEGLPGRCAVQVHWLREEPFESLLARHGFRVVVPARHPMDVLISGLNYEQYLAEPSRWRNPEGFERTLSGATPRSPEFIEYATANHPGSVLSFSPSWWTAPGVVRVRYAELVADTAGALARLVEELGVEPLAPIAEVVEACSFDRARSSPEAWQYHYWQGQVGLWRVLLTPWVAGQILGAQREVFRVLGYSCEPDLELDGHRADANWYRLQYHSLRRHLEEERARHARTRQALEETLDRGGR